jgi:hypothetical protein
MPAPTQRRVILGPSQLVTRPHSRCTTEIIDSTALVQVSERARPAGGPRRRTVQSRAGTTSGREGGPRALFHSPCRLGAHRGQWLGPGRRAPITQFCRVPCPSRRVRATRWRWLRAALRESRSARPCEDGLSWPPKARLCLSPFGHRNE